MAKNVQPRYVQAVISVTAGTSQATPAVTLWDVGDVVIDALAVRIPPGHAGLTGLAILYGDTPLIPWPSGGAPLLSTADFLIGDDVEWPFTLGFEVSNPLVVKAFNGDVYDHAFYLRAQVRDLSALDQQPTSIVAVTVSGLPDTSTPATADLLDAAAPPLPSDAELAIPASVGSEVPSL